MAFVGITSPQWEVARDRRDVQAIWLCFSQINSAIQKHALSYLYPLNGIIVWHVFIDVKYAANNSWHEIFATALVSDAISLVISIDIHPAKLQH